MKDIFQKTEAISRTNKDRDIFKRIAKMQEELGELSTELLKIDGYKPSDEDKLNLFKLAREEAADVVLVAMDIVHVLGIDESTLENLILKKLPKWASNIHKVNKNLEVRNG